MDDENIEKILKTLESYAERLDILEEVYRVSKEKKPATDMGRRLDGLQTRSNTSLNLLKMESRLHSTK